MDYLKLWKALFFCEYSGSQPFMQLMSARRLLAVRQSSSSARTCKNDG